MNSLFKPYLRKFVLVFFYDILVYNKNESNHLEHLQMVLTCLTNNSFFAKRSKCNVGKDQIEYLGHVVTASRVKLDFHKIEAILNWPLLE